MICHQSHQHTLVSARGRNWAVHGSSWQFSKLWYSSKGADGICACHIAPQSSTVDHGFPTGRKDDSSAARRLPSSAKRSSGQLDKHPEDKAKKLWCLTLIGLTSMQCHAYPQIKEIMRFQIQSLMVIGISPDNSEFLPVQTPPSRMETNWMAETIVWLQLKGRKKTCCTAKKPSFFMVSECHLVI